MKLRLIVAVLSLALAPTFRLAAQTPPPQLTVTGAAEVRVVPDEIMLSVGVETRDAELTTAVRQHDAAMTNALRFLKSCGVPDRNIQTDFISVQPDYRSDAPQSPRYYTVRKSIAIRLTTTTNLAEVLTGLLNHGVNAVHNVDFRTTQLRQYRDQARALAVKAAREKADDLARELGVKRGKPVTVNAADYGWSAGSYWGGGRAGFMNSFNGVQNYAAAAPAGDSEALSETLALGQISVSANVTVAFQIE